jgi:hypothetical protein
VAHGAFFAVYGAKPTGDLDGLAQSGSDCTVVSSVIAPVADTLSCQQLPTPCSSQEKSTPFGCVTPAGWKPNRLPV